ncbi:MAG: UDP-glucose 4-epimerase [Polyangiales bacterium]|jgi:UDP-glucose 4-epimerase
MRVLVTGGAGFIGSHVVDALLARGDEVLVVDDLSSGNYSNIEGHLANSAFRFVEGDIAKLHGHDDGIEGVVHLAAQVSVARSVEAPFEDMHTNARGLVQVLLFAAAQEPPAKVVYASSAAVYGDVQDIPTPESTRCLPLSPYGIHKLAGEDWLRFFEQEHGVFGSPLRFFNVYGPRQDPSSPYSGVISVFAKRALHGAPITINGDGGHTRDFVFVGDVVRGIVAALDLRESTPPLNIGTGNAVSIQYLAETLVELSGGRSRILNGPARAGDIVHSCARVDALAKVLGIRAETPLRDGLKALLSDS